MMEINNNSSYSLTHTHTLYCCEQKMPYTRQRRHFPAFHGGSNDPQWKGSKVSQDTFMRNIFHVQLEKQHSCHIYCIQTCCKRPLHASKSDF